MKRKTTIKTRFDPFFKHRNLYVDKVLERVKMVMLKELNESDRLCEGWTFTIDVVNGSHSKLDGLSIGKVVIDELEDWQLDLLNY